MDRRTFVHGLLAPLIATGTISGGVGASLALGLPEQRPRGPLGEAAKACRPDVARSVYTGFMDLDEYLGELQDGMLVAIAARPSMGKTSLALAIAAHVAVNLRRPVAIFGAPLNETEIRTRMMAFLARVDPWRAGLRLTRGEMGSAIGVGQALAAAPLLIDDHPFLSLEDLAAKVMWNNAQSGLRNGLTVVLAPELLQVEATWQRIVPKCSPLAAALRELGERYGGAVLCELPLGRAVEERADKSPQLTDLEGFSRGFARDADAVVLIHRPFVYDPSEDHDLAEVTTAFNRFGRRGTTALAFEFKGGFADYRWPDAISDGMA